MTIAIANDPESRLNSTHMEYYVDLVDIYLHSVIKTFEVSTYIAVFLSLYASFRFLRNHKIQHEAVRRGKYRQIELLQTPSQLLTGNFKYQAYQTAYISWGFAMQVSFYICVG